MKTLEEALSDPVFLEALDECQKKSEANIEYLRKAREWTSEDIDLLHKPITI